MTPIERSRAQRRARQILQIQRGAAREDIKVAWRKKVVETHPDRHDGDATEFQLVQAAYQIATGSASDDVMAVVLDWAQDPVASVLDDDVTPQRPRRTAIKTRFVGFKYDPKSKVSSDVASGKTLELAPGAVQHVKAETAVGSEAPGYAQERHIVERIRQKGRRVSYIVWSSVQSGKNEVAVPTNMLSGLRGDEEVALKFVAEAEGPATISIPDEQRSSHFPGAQSVRVHFSHGADERPA